MTIYIKQYINDGASHGCFGDENLVCLGLSDSWRANSAIERRKMEDCNDFIGDVDGGDIDVDADDVDDDDGEEEEEEEVWKPEELKVKAEVVMTSSNTLPYCLKYSFYFFYFIWVYNPLAV